MTESYTMLKLNDFDYNLPKELIAQYPLPKRDSSRMLVLNRRTGGIEHATFNDLTSYIHNGDVIVLNDTRVINARLMGKRATGGKAEIFLLEHLGGSRFKALLKPSGRIKENDEIVFASDGLKATLTKKEPDGSVVEFKSNGDTYKEVMKSGKIPLPPYIKRDIESDDSSRYQTVYARNDGATAAPTAGLHFTKEIIEGLTRRSAMLEYVTLHVNYGTFAPVVTEDIRDHKMHSEEFELTPEAAESINKKKLDGARIIAVGTTALRVLETCAIKEHRSTGTQERRDTGTQEHRDTGTQEHRFHEYSLKAKKGKTDLFIYPGYKFKMVDALLTNFHTPKSTLLMLVSAFAGKELIFKAYDEAIRNNYRFFSYGDCMLII